MSSSLVFAYSIIAACAFITGISKGGLGGALGALVTPLLALVLPTPIAIGLALPLFMFGDLFAIWQRWGTWDRKILLATLPGTILGVIVGTYALGKLSAVTMQHLLGFAAIVYTVYKLWDRRRKGETIAPVPTSHPAEGTVFGALAGIASVVANAGSPIYTVYLLLKQVTPTVFVGTSALYFAILNLVKVPGYLSANILQPQTLLLIAWALPLVPFGVWSGKILDRYLDMRTFELLILVFLFITGVVLLLKT